MVDTDEESTGTRRRRREAIETEQFSPEMSKSFKLKIPPADRKKLSFST